jgi:hypothetical protein
MILLRKAILSICMLIFLMKAAAAQNKAVLIQKRWMMTDVVGNKAKKQSYAGELTSPIREMELKNGKFYIYEDGILQATATYTIAAGGKSFLMKDAAETVTVKIISLKADELQAVAFGFMSGKDTMIYKLTTAAQTKTMADKANVKGWKDIAAAWGYLKTAYQRRYDLTASFINTVKANGNFDAALLEELAAAKDKAAALKFEAADLRAQKVKEYQSAERGMQTEVTNCLNALSKYTELQKQESILICRHSMNVCKTGLILN